MAAKPAFSRLRQLALAPLLLFTYQLVILLFDAILHTFFREVRSRGGFNIPKKGAVIFVCAPHHNQFVDPAVVMATTWKLTRRRISLLTAAKSYKTWYIGTPARLSAAIPVERPQDLVKPYEGTIRVEDFGPGNSNNVVVGEGTAFTKTACVKGLVGLTNYLGNAKIARVESDTRLVLAKPFAVNFAEPSDRDRRIMDALTNGAPYVLAPHINNEQTFQRVFDHLNAGRTLGIFPEGGSHDRPTLLPLKPGVAIMALGAVAQAEDPDQVVNIVPVGLNYFHAHKFRSRVVIEYGKPIVVTKNDSVEYEKNSRAVVGKMLELITLRLKEVTVTCDDYDTLIALQAARRLYVPTDREQTPLPLVVEMNRRLVKGYQKYADQPEVRALKDAVGRYNSKLMQLGLHDHQVESLTRSNRWGVLATFVQRSFQVALFLGLAMPGIFMFSPIFIVARRISRSKAKKALAASVVKIKANDVISTWKILVALGLAPMVYIFWALIGTFLLVRSDLVWQVPTWLVFVVFYSWSVLTTYASLRIGEIGVDYYKSLRPLLLSLLSVHNDVLQIEDLKRTREELRVKVVNFCERYGPSMFDDYEKFFRKYVHVDSTDEEPEHTEREGSSFPPRPMKRLNSLSANNLGNVQIFSQLTDAQSAYEGEGSDSDPQSDSEGDRKLSPQPGDPEPRPEEAEASNSKTTTVRKRRAK